MFLPLEEAARLQTKSSQVLQEMVRAALRPFSLSTSEWRALEMIARAGAEGIRLSHIAEHLGVEAARLSQIARRFSRHGYVDCKTDTEDGRAKRYFLTDVGHSLCSETAKALESVLVPLFVDIPREAMAGYFEVLKHIAQNGGDSKEAA